MNPIVKRIFYGQNVVPPAGTPQADRLKYIFVGRELPARPARIKLVDRSVRSLTYYQFMDMAEKLRKYGMSPTWDNIRILAIESGILGTYKYKIPARKAGMTRDASWAEIISTVAGKYGRYSKRQYKMSLKKASEYFEELPSDFSDLMKVKITPIWTDAKIRVVEGGNEHFLSRRRRTSAEIQKTFSKRRIDVWVEVGFLHPNEMHDNGWWRPVSWKSLLHRLMEYGYDPLLPLRDSEYITAVRKKFGNELAKVLNSGHGSFRNVATKIGKELAGYAYAYIMGGVKPPLDKSTISSRERKEEYYDLPYPMGLQEPLVETGMLANEVGYEVYTGKVSEDDIKKQITLQKPTEKKIHRIRDIATSRKTKPLKEISNRTEVYARSFGSGGDDYLIGDVMDIFDLPQ